MRKPFWIALAIVVALFVALRPPSPGRIVIGPVPPEDGGAPDPVAASPRETSRLTVLNRRGAETVLTIDEDTEVLVVASWCPYTRQLNAVLRDRRSRPHLEGKRLVYLFEYDELDRRLSQAVREGRVSREEAREYLGSLPEGPRLSNPDFLPQVAAHEVYYFDARYPLDYGGYPTAFSAAPNVFRTNYAVWVRERLRMPRSLQQTLFAAYAPGGAAQGGTSPR